MSEAPPPPAGFRGRFSTDPEDLRAHAGAAGPVHLVPSAVAVPADGDDAARLVAWASREGVALVPRGAGTGMPGGNVGPGVVVDLASAFEALEPVDREARRVRAGAGVVAAKAARAAAEAGLYLPPLPSSAERCTLGGMVANNAAGARSLRHGAVRDWVVELDVVLGTGERVGLGPDAPAPEPFPALARRLAAEAGSPPAGWPAVRKNSSGYALDRFLPGGDAVQLLVGSEGTLGLVLGVTLRLADAPARRGVVLAALPDLDDLPGAAEAARRAGASACELFGARILEMARLDRDPEVGPLARGAEGLLLLEVEGPPDAVEEGMARLRRLADDLGGGFLEARGEDARERLWEVRHRASPTIARAAASGRISTQFIEDCVVPPARVADYARGVRAILDDAGMDGVIFGHAGDGNLHVNPLVDVHDPGWRDRVRRVLEATVDLVAGLGGTLSGEHGDGRVRAPLLARVWPAPLVRAFGEVKAALDPAGVLNPGVILPRPGQDPLEGLGAAFPRS